MNKQTRNKWDKVIQEIVGIYDSTPIIDTMLIVEANKYILKLERELAATRKHRQVAALLKSLED